MTDSNDNTLDYDFMDSAIATVLALIVTSPGNTADKHIPPEAWQTWLVGLFFITLCSFFAPLGILTLPYLERRLYDHIMNFLIALGIGTLTGSCFFIMLPQAFGLTIHDSHDEMAWFMVASLYGFFIFDRILLYISEIRRRYVSTQKQSNELPLEMFEVTICDEEVQMQQTSEKSKKEGHRKIFTRRLVAAVKRLWVFLLESTRKLPVSEDSGQEVEQVSVQVMKRSVAYPKNHEISSIAYIIIVGSSLNNLVDGINIGVAFASNLDRGVLIGICAFSQQFPQEVGTLAILACSGLGIKRTLLINLIPAFLSYLGFAIGVILNNEGDSYKSFICSVSVGMYLYVFLGTVIPEVRGAAEELIKSNIRESLLVTLIQFLGMGGGVTFMYFMNKYTEEKLREYPNNIFN